MIVVGTVTVEMTELVKVAAGTDVATRLHPELICSAGYASKSLASPESRRPRRGEELRLTTALDAAAAACSAPVIFKAVRRFIGLPGIAYVVIAVWY